MTHDALVRFRAGFATCELAALVDVSTGTVLMADSAVRLGQEHLDTLSQIASDLWSGGNGGWPGSVIHSGPTGSRLFLHSPYDEAEVLCCLFGPRADLTQVDAAARRLWDSGLGAQDG
jgi:hypothetical protein